jgi:hypothetical protein
MLVLKNVSKGIQTLTLVFSEAGFYTGDQLRMGKRLISAKSTEIARVILRMDDIAPLSGRALGHRGGGYGEYT